MVSIVPYESKHFIDTMKYLAFLKPNYPNYIQWANRKLNTVGTVTYLALNGTEIMGVAVGAAKPNKRFKISTFYVTPNYRNNQVGSTLLSAMEQQAVLNQENVTVYMTANSELRNTLGVFLEKKKFFLVNSVTGRYMPNQTEDVYEKTLPLYEE